MSIKKIQIKFQFGENGYADKRAIILALIIIYIVSVMIHLENLFQSSRESNSSSYILNNTVSNVLLKCNIPYDKYRCSVLSNKFDHSINCITNAQAMTGHILPLVLYALQLYLIREFFSFTEHYNYFFTDIFRIIAFSLFVIIAVAAHGSSCLHFYTCMSICLTGICLSSFVFYQLVHNNYKHILRKIYNIFKNNKLIANNQDQRSKLLSPNFNSI